MIWYDIIRYDMIWYDICDMIWYDMIWYMIWYDMICKVPMAVKVMCKYYSTVFECALKHYSNSFFKLPE